MICYNFTKIKKTAEAETNRLINAQLSERESTSEIRQDK